MYVDFYFPLIILQKLQLKNRFSVKYQYETLLYSHQEQTMGVEYIFIKRLADSAEFIIDYSVCDSLCKYYLLQDF